MTSSHPVRILSASLIAVFAFAPAALASWHDPGGSPGVAKVRYTVAAHRTASHHTKVSAIARAEAETKRLDATYRFDRVPPDER